MARLRQWLYGKGLQIFQNVLDEESRTPWRWRWDELEDIVLGCFYLTEDRPSAKQAGRVFAESTEALLAHAELFHR